LYGLYPAAFCSAVPFGPGTISDWIGVMFRHPWSVASSLSRSNIGSCVYGTFDRAYR